MTTQVSQGMSEEQLVQILTVKPHWKRDYEGHNKADDAIGDLIVEVRRLQQREADLLTALTLQEDLNKELQEELAAEVSHPAPETITGPGWLNQEDRS